MAERYVVTPKMGQAFYNEVHGKWDPGFEWTTDQIHEAAFDYVSDHPQLGRARTRAGVVVDDDDLRTWSSDLVDEYKRVRSARRGYANPGIAGVGVKHLLGGLALLGVGVTGLVMGRRAAKGAGA